MKVFVRGEDRTDSLGALVTEAAEKLESAELEETMRRESDVLALRETRDEAQFQARHAKLLRSRDRLDTSRFVLPPPEGVVGKIAFFLRMFLWKLLRYQHDWVAFVQNGINVQQTQQMEMERRNRKRDFADLEKRVAALEKRERGES
jgi:hypothetical protein